MKNENTEIRIQIEELDSKQSQEADVGINALLGLEKLELANEFIKNKFPNPEEL